MSQPDPVSVFEIDLDYCDLAFGQGLCGASLQTLQTRTNSFLRSQDFSNAYWTKTQVTLTGGFSDPLGGMNAYKVFPTAVNAVHRFRLSGGVSVISGTTYTSSCFVKKGINVQYALFLGVGGLPFPNTTNHRLIVNLDTGTITSQGSSLTGAGIEDCGSGWWRVWASAVAQASGVESQPPITLVSGGATTFLGVVTDYIYAFGSQFEAGVGPSAYKLTTSATVSAAHGGAVRKCYNTWNTCKYKAAYKKGSKTYKFVTENSGFPVGLNYIPALSSVSGRSGTVNIAGSDDRLSSLGERAVINAKLVDFVDSDILTDKYQAERITGAAQTDEGGYNPRDRLSFWAKLKARNPNYAGRSCRVIQGTLSNGVFTAVTTRHFVLTSIDGPDSNGNVTIEAKDILSLAGNEKAIAPKAGRGFLSADIAADAVTVTMLPAGIGSEYKTSGVATIGSEIVAFTRSGDVLTLTRGQSGTVAAEHKVNDTVQPVFAPRLQRIDSVIRELLVDYANVPSAYIPYTTWQAECDRWATNLLLTADICKPEGVEKLIGELAVLGITIWWDDVAQLIQLKINRPPDTDAVPDITDANNNISISQEDREEDRLTRVSFWSVQIDPTKAMSKDNFLRQRLLIDADAEIAANYNGSQVKEIYCRWLNHGADSLIRILSKRLLNRFNKQPVQYEVTLDAKDDLSLAQVIRMTSRVIADESGKSLPQLMQVISRNDVRNGSTLKVKAQKFAFDQRYGYVTEDTRPLYSASSDAQKARGAYFVNPTTLVFGDGSGPYVFS